MPHCILCSKELKLKAACICADCVRDTSDPEVIRTLLNPKGSNE